MHLWEWAAIVCFLLGFVGMGAVLAYRLYRNPFLLAGLIPTLWAHAKPVLLRIIMLRNSQEDERRMVECIRRGGEWDNFRKRCKERR